MGTSDFYAVSQKLGEQPKLVIGICSGGQACRTEPFTYENRRYLWVNSVRMQMNYRTLSWCYRIACRCGGTHPAQWNLVLNP